MTNNLENLWKGFFRLSWEKTMMDAKYIRILLNIIREMLKERSDRQ